MSSDDDLLKDDIATLERFVRLLKDHREREARQVRLTDRECSYNADVLRGAAKACLRVAVEYA